MVTAYLDAVQPVRDLAENEVQTHEGGIAFAVDPWTRLRRFLILGTQGGSFYSPERDLTIENVGVVRECLAADGARTIAEIVAISDAGRAPKHDPAVLALAMATLDAAATTRALAFAALPQVCRIGTHLLHFAAYREALGGGWGRGMRRAVGAWFTDKSPRDLAYQAVKYPSRDRWALADLLRLSHPTGTGDFDYVAQHILEGGSPLDDESSELEYRRFLVACDILRLTHARASDKDLQNIRELRIPREALSTDLLSDPKVWEALLDDMPMTAMIRNLGKMGSIGLLDGKSNATNLVLTRLTDAERLKKARVHPIAILAALKVYEQGHGEKGKLTWTANKRVVNALDEAFYLAFGAVVPTKKRIRLALDVSGSMDGSKVNGMPFLSAREASAALALVTAAVEPNAHFVAYSTQLVGLTIRPSMRLDEVIRGLAAIPMGGTYCTLPIQHAIDSGAEIDAFVSYTDSETLNGGVRGYSYWGGGEIPSKTASEALVEYRLRSGINARHAVVALTANQFSIADPRDAGQLDVAGFDAATPGILSDFIAGMV